MRGRRPEKLTIARRHADVLHAAAHSGSLPWFQVQRARIVLARSPLGRRQCSVAGPLECDEATVSSGPANVYRQGGFASSFAERQARSFRAARSRFPPCNGHRS